MGECYNLKFVYLVNFSFFFFKSFRLEHLILTAEKYIIIVICL